MHFDSTNNIYFPNMTVGMYSTVNTVAPHVAAEIPQYSQIANYQLPIYGFTAAEVFAQRSRAANSMLQGFLTMCAITNNDPEDDDNIASALSEGGRYYATQLKRIIASYPPLNINKIDDQILERTWCKFYNETCECINIIEKTPEILRSGIGAGFLLPEMSGQINEHMKELKKIDTIITAMQSPGHSAISTQTDVVRVPPSRRYGSTRHPRFARPLAMSTTNIMPKKVIAVVHVEIQTTTNVLSHSETQTSVKPQKSSKTQTDSPIKIHAKSCATQSEDPANATKMTQTNVRSSGFSRDIKTQTARNELRHKNVGTDIRLSDASAQTESKDIQLLNHGWHSLQVMVEKLTSEITSNPRKQLDEKNWPSPESISADLDLQYSQLFALLKEVCSKTKTAYETRELWSTFVHHYLPCMEQLRSARSQLLASLCLTQFTKADQNKKTVIGSVVAVLDKAVLITLETHQWIKNFKWEDYEEKKSALTRWQTFAPKAEVLQKIMTQQFRLGEYTYGRPKLPLPDKPPANQNEPLNLHDINDAMSELAAIVDIEDFSIEQNNLINDLVNKYDVFKNANMDKIEHYLFHIWLPSVTTIKLLAQKQLQNKANPETFTKLEHTINILMRDARWGIKKICSTQFNEKNIANDPVKMRLIKAFKTIATPESFGILADASIVQELVAFKFSEMHRAYGAQHSSQTPLSFLITCLMKDDFALDAVEEWSNLIAKIKAESLKIIETSGFSSGRGNDYMNYLKLAQTCYTTTMRPNTSKQNEKLEYTKLKNLVATEKAIKLFGSEDLRKKAINTLENLAKNLGM